MASVFHHQRYYRLLSAVALVFLLVSVSLAASSTFEPQARLGFPVGDQWEPAIAADGYGHVYALYPQYGGVPGCRSCPLPSMILVVSNDNGITWQPPHEITPHTTGQFDPQIVVDPVDHRTAYAAWLQNRNTEAVVAKSADFGQSWSVVIADRGKEDADKPILTVRGEDVYVALNRSRKMRVASSHDGGVTFSSVDVNPGVALVRSLAGGATVDLDRNAYIAWAGYQARDGAKGRVKLFISKSRDGGKSWTAKPIASSGAPPGCSAFRCEWGYFGAQITMTSDAAGTLYALWNSGKSDYSPERISFASSTTAGYSWSPRVDVSHAPSGVEHAFPALVAGEAGDVRIAWMDNREGGWWNTHYRSSSNGGVTWSPELRISSYVPGYRYIRPKGFSFPFGDYFEIAIDSKGRTQAVWGEGLNFRSPGSIWYSNGR